MILVDANLLIYAVNRDAPRHKAARAWFEQVLSGDGPVGLPWVCLLAFLRITTRPGIVVNPLTVEKAVGFVESWLKQPFVEPVTPRPRSLADTAPLAACDRNGRQPDFRPAPGCDGN